MLGQYLNFHRATLQLKCAGHSTEQLYARHNLLREAIDGETGE